MFLLFFFLMIRRPPRSTLDRSSAASDVYKRQIVTPGLTADDKLLDAKANHYLASLHIESETSCAAVSYTHLRAHETVLDIVCRLLLEKKKTQHQDQGLRIHYQP